MNTPHGGDAHSDLSQTTWSEGLLPHKHAPLRAKGKSTRLLQVQLEPAREHIKCTLSQHGLENMPPYVALSYTWNQGSRRRRIECDGSNLEIGDNLWQFLFEFRKRESIRQYEESQPEPNVSYLWIDAICIDQTNLQERNFQVAQMREIYSGAESVIVWLGVSIAHEELVFLIIRYPELLKVRRSQEELIVFLDKPYFKRVWVVQEFILARDLSIWCGHLAAEAESLYDILKEHSEKINSIMQTAAWPLFHYRRNFHSVDLRGGGPSFQLRDLLLSFAALQSSETYDRIYGFLGIARNNSEGWSISPDYSKPPVEVLVDVLRNECHSQSRRVRQEDHALLVFLMQVLKVSRLDFAHRLRYADLSMREHLYVLATFGRMTASLRKIGSIRKMGQFTYVSEFTTQHMQLALLESAAAISSIPSSTIKEMSSQLANPRTVLDLDGSNSRKAIKSSVQAMIQSVSTSERTHDNPDDGIIRESSISQAAFDITKFRRLLCQSLIDYAKASFNVASPSRQEETRYLHRTYAVFDGTNGIVGGICDVSCTGRLPKKFDDIYTFADDPQSNMVLIVDGRNIEDLAIVGTAVITRTEEESSGIAQSLQNLFRTGTGEMARSMSASISSLRTEGELARVCFHTTLPELLELIRCGVLNEGQLQRLVEETFGGECDEMHLCSVGNGQHPSLKFGA